METYTMLIYTSLFCGFIGLTLLFLKKTDSTTPKYFDYFGKCFITIGFCLLAISVLGNRFKKDNEKLNNWLILLSISIILISIFLSI